MSDFSGPHFYWDPPPFIWYWRVRKNLCLQIKTRATFSKSLHKLCLIVTLLLFLEQKCSQCKGMCCEKPPTTKPPTTTATTTKKAISTTHIITTTKVKAIRSETGTKSSSPRRVRTRITNSERERETETNKAQRSKSSTTPQNPPQPATTAPRSIKDQSGRGSHNCSENVRSSNQMGENLKGTGQ